MNGLPIEIKALLTFLITQGAKALVGLFGKDFGGMASAITAVVIGSALFFADGLLALVPVDYQDTIGAALALIVSLLSAFGVHYTYKNIA